MSCRKNPTSAAAASAQMMLCAAKKDIGKIPGIRKQGEIICETKCTIKFLLTGLWSKRKAYTAKSERSYNNKKEFHHLYQAFL